MKETIQIVHFGLYPLVSCTSA